MTKLKNLTVRKFARQIKLKKSGLSLKPSRASAIVGILTCLMMCGSCSAVNNERISEPCLTTVVTYGDAVECAIKLNEVNR